MGNPNKILQKMILFTKTILMLNALTVTAIEKRQDINIGCGSRELLLRNGQKM
jgi:hypothetical protein